MKERTIKWRQREAGVVLLIAIFVLMLVSVVAMALIVSSGTESALAANYRSSATVYYAAMAGLEEARGRLQPKNPDYFNNTVAGFMPAGGAPLLLGSVRYIRNSTPGDPVDPTDPGNPYFDGEYGNEFGGSITGAPDVQQIDSVSGVNAAGIPGPVFKWVRINGVTETSLNIDVDGGPMDSTTLLYYDPSHTLYGNVKPSLIVPTGAPPSTAVQALEVTSLAVLPNGSRKLLQYVLAPTGLNLQFPSALTLVGNNVHFTEPSPPTYFFIDGHDQFDVGSCNASSNRYEAIGYVNGTDASDGNIRGAIAPGYYNHYTGQGGVTPNLSQVGLPASWLKPSGLDQLVQTITGTADVVITPTPMGGPGTLGTAHGSDLPSTSQSNPKTIVINGNLDLNAWHQTGYGLLVITGDFKFDPDAYWDGIVLVIGQGNFISTQGGSGEFHGALLIAKTRYPPGGGANALQLIPDNGDQAGSQPDSALGQASFSQTGGGNGVFYSSCWIKAVQTGVKYKVLSFREIPQ